MNLERNNFNFLLDNLRAISENFQLNDDGTVVNKCDNVEINEYIIINTKFYTLYCNAYKELAAICDGYPIKEVNEHFVKRALSDYDTFNSFVKNCVFEYHMYNDLGTGYISYFPNYILADLCFKNKSIVLDYFKCEFNNVFDDKQNNERVRK